MHDCQYEPPDSSSTARRREVSRAEIADSQGSRSSRNAVAGSVLLLISACRNRGNSCVRRGPGSIRLAAGRCDRVVGEWPGHARGRGPAGRTRALDDWRQPSATRDDGERSHGTPTRAPRRRNDLGRPRADDSSRRPSAQQRSNGAPRREYRGNRSARGCRRRDGGPPVRRLGRVNSLPHQSPRRFNRS